MGEAALVSFEQERMRRVFASLRGAVVEMTKRKMDEVAARTIEGLKSGKRTLMDFVKGAREIARAVEEEATSALVESFGPDELRATTATCEGCGRTLKMKRLDERTVETMTGPVTIRRPYFHCERCGRRFHPADEVLALAPGRKQFDLLDASTLLSTEVPFETASKILKRIAGREVSADLAHDTVSEMGEGLSVLDVAPTAEEVRAKIEAFATPGGPKPVLQITIDGAMVSTRPDKARDDRPGPKKVRANRANWKGEWREEKGFRIVLVKGDRIEQIMNWHQVMTEEGVEKALVAVRDAGLIPEDLARVCVAADGAKWIWNVTKRVLPGARQVLDYGHLKEHLHAYAALKFSASPDRSAAWIEATKGRICQR